VSSGPIISAEGLGKRYVIRHEQREPYLALRDVLTEGVRRLGRRLVHPARAYAGATREEFWALRDVSFDVKEGDRLGIIGRNGAGKSTLLKLLSRITEPSAGRITLRGRVASLLEVGTGFHPELTGRENVTLNGVILGMTRQEVRRRFDEIVEFAGIETFLDTPVKRYSSGMYMRLAFAVAAHLECEILIVDEVLAVGDAAFQQKCLGKMQEIGEQGRTVLFVSHNMGAIAQFCSAAMLLDEGAVVARGDVQRVIGAYFGRGQELAQIRDRDFIGPLARTVHFRRLLVNGSASGADVSPADEITFTVHGHSDESVPRFRMTLVLYRDGVRLATLHDCVEPSVLEKGQFEFRIVVPQFHLRSGSYSVALGGHDGGVLAGGHDWMFSHPLATFTVQEEWSARNDFTALGLVNIPHRGERIGALETEPPPKV
jgi:lipopolysaccharide transport system ATP-binding protein